MAKLKVSSSTSTYFWGCSNCNRGGVEFSESARDHHLGKHRCPRPRVPPVKTQPEPSK